MADATAPPANGGSGNDDGPVPPGLDPAIPSPARMYDFYLGGKDNYAVDREAAGKALAVVPDGRSVARANRRFLVRAVLFMAGQGIDQFIDLGTGIPTSPSVHEVARSVRPDARVLYVDCDPVVTAHNSALLATSDGVLGVQGDIREPRAIFNSPEMEQLIDFSQPVGVLFVAVLHFIPGQDDPAGIVRAFTHQMVPGSYLAISHITSDGTDPEVVATIEDAYAKASAPAVFRSTSGIRELFAGVDLLHPGLAGVSEWRPLTTASFGPLSPPALRILAGVGRKQ